jgi:ABC-type sugar transport system ATPase subunit
MTSTDQNSPVTAAPTLKLEGITKSFGPVRALKGSPFRYHATKWWA